MLNGNIFILPHSLIKTPGRYTFLPQIIGNIQHLRVVIIERVAAYILKKIETISEEVASEKYHQSCR
jgi:adenylate kinase